MKSYIYASALLCTVSFGAAQTATPNVNVSLVKIPASAGMPAYPSTYNSAYNQMVMLLGDSSGPSATYNFNQFLSYSKPGYTQLVPGGKYYRNNSGIVGPNN